MSLQGKGFFISQPYQCEGGNPSAILMTAQAAGLSHVLVKIAEGTQASGLNPAGNDLNEPLVQALHATGIAVWGWHNVSGNNPLEEAVLAIRRVHELALDGYVLFVGAAYEQPGKELAARAFMAEVRAELSNVPLALSTYRFPNFHPGLPWAAFLENCDAVMPQVYWEAAHNAGAQLTESLRQYRALPNARPCIPTGAAYGTPDGWAPTNEDMDDFFVTAKELGVEAVNFFSWDACRNQLPQLWDLIAASKWPVQKTAAMQLPLVWPHTVEGLSAATSSHSWDYPPAGRGQPSGDATIAEADDYLPAGGEQSSGEAAITSAVDHPPMGGGQSSGKAAVTSEVDYPPAGGGQPVASDSQAGEFKARFSSHPPRPDAFTTQYLNALKSYQAAKVSALYAKDAIHVRGDKVLNGAQVIRTGYSAFFYGLPAGATFVLLGVEVRGDVRYLAWKAGPLTAYESIILRDGIIILEYTYIE